MHGSTYVLELLLGLPDVQWVFVRGCAEVLCKCCAFCYIRQGPQARPGCCIMQHGLSNVDKLPIIPHGFWATALTQQG